jgi:hypothetical protein
MRVRDDGTRYWRPRIDVEIAGGAVQTLGRFDQHQMIISGALMYD